MSTPALTSQHKLRRCDPEADVLAREMGATFGGLTKSYRDHFGLSPEEAREKAHTHDSPEEYLQHLENTPPDQVTFLTLDQLAAYDPALARRRWEDVKEAALEELRSGHLAARVLEPAGSDCWDRAKFLAIRHELMTDWQPRNGIERLLIDTLAQAQTCYVVWLGRLTAYTMLEKVKARRLEEEEGRWAPPRVSDVEAIKLAAEMVERFNRIQLRTLRALCNVRRCSPQIIVQNAGQVNIGGGS